MQKIDKNITILSDLVKIMNKNISEEKFKDEIITGNLINYFQKVNTKIN
jgi:hypothetical protein